MYQLLGRPNGCMICFREGETMQTEATTCAAIESVVKQLVEFRQVGASSYINMPLLYPDGSCVTLRIDRLSDRFRVSDNGFAYREIEDLGAERSFAGTAAKIVEKEGLQSNRRAIYCDVLPDEMFRAVCDVSTDRKSVVEGKRVSVRVDLGGRRILK